MFEIKNDFVPPEPHKKGPELPLGKLEVGDSFLVPHETMKYGTVKVRVSRHLGKYTSVRIRVFKEADGSRVYRTA